LTAAKLPRSAFRPVRSRFGFAVAQRNQAGEAEINSDTVRRRSLERLHLDVEDHIPLAVLAGENCRHRLAGQFPVPSNLDCASQADDRDAILFDAETVADTKFGGV
jgi:hypothetical protein